MKLKDALDKHRKEAYLTCPEDCMCWKVEQELSIHERMNRGNK